MIKRRIKKNVEMLFNTADMLGHLIEMVEEDLMVFHKLQQDMARRRATAKPNQLASILEIEADYNETLGEILSMLNDSGFKVTPTEEGFDINYSSQIPEEEDEDDSESDEVCDDCRGCEFDGVMCNCEREEDDE